MSDIIEMDENIDELKRIAELPPNWDNEGRFLSMPTSFKH
jgi:hypothetical protein